MIIDNLKQELIDNEVNDIEKVLEIFSNIKEPITCISPSNPEHKNYKLVYKQEEGSVTTTAGRNVIILNRGLIMRENLRPAIIQTCNNEITYYF